MEKLKGIDKRIYLQLENLYPDKVVISLHQKNPSLYNEINKRIEETKYSSFKEYIESIGFMYTRKEKYTLETFLEELTKLYPEKILQNGIAELRKNNALFYQLGKISKKENLSLTDFMIAHGFTVYGKTNSKLNYDSDAIKKVKDNYICNLTELSLLIGTSKQNIMQKLKRKKQVPPYWQCHELNDLELSLVLKMIENEVYFLQDTETNIAIKLYKHNIESQSFALFIFDQANNKIKCFFDDLSDRIREKLINQGYDKYYEQDFEIKKALLVSSMATINQNGGTEIRLQNGSDISGKISHRLNKAYSHLSRGEYIEYLGFKHVDGRFLTNDELINQLSKYVIEGNYVYIPSSDPQHARMANIAHNRGFKSFKEFVEYLGFNYKRMRVTNAQDKIIEKLKKHYTVEGNKVYISTYDPLYVNLNGYVQNRNKKNLAELLAEWGLERVYLEDLPSDYEPYDWQKEMESKTFGVESDYQELLDELVIENNYVYLDSESSLYNKLFVLAVKKGTTINDLLKEWGYERVYAKGSADDRDTILMSSLNSDEEREHVGESLENVMNIQGDLSRSTTTVQRVERSRKLAREMKKLYSYRCQLCNYEEEGKHIPLIKKLDGTNYVEVHHIIPVSEQDKVVDDSTIVLDSYENVIVVCPHHHRFLHYHDGGFEALFETEQDELFFRSQNGYVIKIYTNFHLKAKKKRKVLT